MQLIFLLLSLVWGTVNLNDRRNVAKLFAQNKPEQENGILDEDFWDFGQWVPVLLLLMPAMNIVDTYSRESFMY